MNAGVAWLLGPTAMMALDIIAISFFVTEFLLTGELGGWEGSDFYEQNIAFLFLYHYVFDWDGTIIRMVVLREQLKLEEIRFSGNKKE